MVRGMGQVKIPHGDVTLVPYFCLHNQSFLSARSVYGRKMSSDSEMSDLSERSSNTEEGETEEEEDEDVKIIYSQLTPYQDEPLAEVDTSDNTRDANDIEEGEFDEDGLTAATLEARYERETPVNLWLINSSFILCCDTRLYTFEIAKTNLSHQITHHTILY